MNVYEVITNRIIEQLQRNTVPWRKPWSGVSNVPAQNLISRKPYRGINVWLLASSGFSSPYWVTYRQAESLGGHVRKGEKSTPVVFYSTFDRERPNGALEASKAWVLRYYNVFNTAQCDGLTVPTVAEDTRMPHERIASAEAIVSGMPSAPAIEHGKDAAWYRPSADVVGMPDLDRFTTAEHYYATLFHELAHSTGHASRLNRDTLTKTAHFGRSDYSKEELVAEMGAAFLCNTAGIMHADIEDNTAAYLKNWIAALKGDSRLIVQAATKAQQAAEYILGTATTGDVTE